MIKSVDIENYLASSKMQKYFQKKFGKIFLKIFENWQFLIIEKRYFKKSTIFKDFLRNLPNFFLEIFLHF